MSEALVEELAQAQRLALTYAPRRARPQTAALLVLDSRLAGIIRTAREPLMAQLRLAWWRDNLAKPAAEWPRGEPLLGALRSWREPAALVPLVSGWEALLADDLTAAVIAEFAQGRAAGFTCLAHELGIDAAEPTSEAAAIFALADLAANLSDAEERSRVVRQASSARPPRLPTVLRPLAVLAGLGRAALDRGGGPLLAGPGSVARALRIGLSGR